jgi:hypothetical protein
LLLFDHPLIVNESEVKFIQNLEKYLNREKNTSPEWIFIKIDETLDEGIELPHFYRKKNNSCKKNFPDFSFFLE